MENAERLVNKTAEIHEFASEVARMITGAQMPEFSSENISVADASKLIGLPATSIRAGIAITGYTPLGIVQCSFATTWFVPTGVYIDSSGAHIGVRDVGSPTASTANANCYITILYVKNN